MKIILNELGQRTLKQWFRKVCPTCRKVPSIDPIPDVVPGQFGTCPECGNDVNWPYTLAYKIRHRKAYRRRLRDTMPVVQNGATKA